jgi:crotonobetainyl-CoA:carnitine CoA-transferase CaiB-like acyl-CoA transferase
MSRRASPTIGQDNEYVYGELLGMSSRGISDLVDRKVIY